ncbi:carbohydrate ABC transporter permease [Thalassospira sp. TSL5-1]|uniref:carbohydrate ABC transporter permease n=1 Tax=Thalassospira sp. TSL5-1 TaxID=1544451 RepID=UPI0009396AA2|nr:carbohydrate ABC transporter permease [Thalassospira sp. TSL5-1]OKH88793.1 sugar ABC transporter permease [Thalassospira sp. TSL5-1]
MTQKENAVARGRKPKKMSPARYGLYGLLIISAAFFLTPLYVMIVTSLKTLDEVRLGKLFALPSTITFDAWIKAWSTACTGVTCEGISPGFVNSVQITVISVIISVMLGAVNGYALSFWRYRGANVLFGILVMGAFVPFQAVIYPLIVFQREIGIFGSLAGIVMVHCIFGMPIITLIFRNYFSSLPEELFKAARIDGAGFWQIFLRIMMPMSVPITAVAVILQTTGIWNDYLLGLVFGGRDNQPMTVQLNNIVTTSYGVREYNVNMAATILTAAVPLAIYFLSGRFFVKGIAAGAVKG